MLAFFGLERSAAGTAPSITATQALDPLRHIWLKRSGQNHLRISRMIRSLYLCHQPALAQAFQSAVIKNWYGTGLRLRDFLTLLAECHPGSLN